MNPSNCKINDESTNQFNYRKLCDKLHVTQRKLNCRNLQLKEYQKRIQKLELANQELKQQLSDYQQKMKMKIVNLNETINMLKHKKAATLNIKSKKTLQYKNHVKLKIENDNLGIDSQSSTQNSYSSSQPKNDENESSISNSSSQSRYINNESSISNSLVANTQDKQFQATPDVTDVLFLGSDSDYDPESDENNEAETMQSSRYSSDQIMESDDDENNL